MIEVMTHIGMIFLGVVGLLSLVAIVALVLDFAKTLVQK